MVVVNVLDVNDERPDFSVSSFSLGIEENLPPGVEVGILTATDADDPPFNQFTYSFRSSGSLSDAFSIDALTGQIVTSRSLDRELQDRYVLVAVVRDDHSPSLTGTASVTIHVMDTNDHPPVFVRPQPTDHNETSGVIAVLVQPGAMVTQVRSTQLFSSSILSSLLSSSFSCSSFSSFSSSS